MYLPVTDKEVSTSCFLSSPAHPFHLAGEFLSPQKRHLLLCKAFSNSPPLEVPTLDSATIHTQYTSIKQRLNLNKVRLWPYTTCSVEG